MNPSIDLKIIKNVLKKPGSKKKTKRLVNCRHHFRKTQQYENMHILYTNMSACMCVCDCVCVCVYACKFVL